MPKLSFYPATPDCWADIEVVFGECRDCAGCWCMWWRLASFAWKRNKGAENRRLLRKIAKSGQTPGILAYVG